MAQYSWRQHEKQDADIFTRVWNSTLGLPEQLVRRLVRAATDPDVDLFSEEGLLDTALVPLFGVLDSHSEDVLEEEWVDIVLPEGTPNNFGTQLGLAIATDPLSWLAAPLSLMGKGGRAAGKLGRQLGKGLPENATVEQALKAGRAALQKNEIVGRDRGKLRKSMAALEKSGIDKELRLTEANAFANKRNLAIAAPLLGKLGHWAPKRLEGYKSWWQVLKLGTDKSLALAAPFGAASTKLPLVGRAFKMVGTAVADAAFGAKAGFKTAGRAMFKAELDRGLEPGTIDPLLDRMTPSVMRTRKHLQRLGGRLQKVGADFEKRLDKAKDLRRDLDREIVGENVDIIEELRTAGIEIDIRTMDPIGVAREGLAHDRKILSGFKRSLNAAKDRAKKLARKRNKADRAKYLEHKKDVAEWEDLVKHKQADVDKIAGILNPRTRAPAKKNLRRKITEEQKVTHARSFLRALGMRTKKLSEEAVQDEASRVWRHITNSEAGPLPIRGKELQVGVDRFQADMDQALKELFEKRTAMAATEASKLEIKALERGGVSRLFYKVFNEAERLRIKAFTSGVSSKEFIKQENDLWSAMARTTEAVQSNYLALLNRVPEAAREMGLTPDQFRDVIRNTLESSSFTAEIEALLELAPQDLAKFHKSVEDFVTRSETATDMLQGILRARGGAKAKQAGDSLLDRLRGTLDEGVTEAKYREKLSDSVIPARIKDYNYGGIDPSHPTMRRVKKGKHAGLRLIHISDTGLKKLMREGSNKAEREAAAEVLDLRADGKSKYLKPERIEKEQLPVPPRKGGKIESVDHLGEEYELGEHSYLLAQLLSDTAELKRTGEPSTELISRIQDNLMRASSLVEDTVRQGMGDTGKFILDETRRIQGEILIGAHNAGALAAGAPIAYVPRIFSAERAKEINRILADVSDDVIQSIAPTFGSTISRRTGALTIEELEGLSVALRNREPRKAAQLEKLLKASGVDTKRYTDDPFEAIFTRYAQHGSHQSTRDFVNSVISDPRTGVIAGRVTGVFSETGHVLDLDEVRRIAAQSGDDATTIQPISDEVLDEIRGIRVLDDTTGKEYFISATSLDDDSVLFALGALGDDAGTAFANRTSRGDLFRKGGVYKQSEALTREAILGLNGQHVIFGNAMTTLGIGGSLSKQYKVAPTFIQWYDTAHGIMRRFQTVFRLPFHISNLASGFFQARMNGVSSYDASMGMFDALRLLSKQKEIVGQYDRYVKAYGKGNGVIPLLGATRRAGIDGIRELPGSEGYVFKFGEQSIDMQEFIDATIKHNLFSSFVSEGLRGSNSVTRTLELLRDAAEGRGITGKLRKLSEKASSVGETSETVVRIAGVMSNLRAGMNLDDAVLMTKNAMVDYAKVTPVEKTYLKRVFSYYTFPRHYIPFAWRKFAEEPKIAANLAHTVKAALGNGLAIDENGNVEVRLDDWRVNVQRMDANMDALMSGVAIVNFLAPNTLGASSSIEGSPASPAFLEAGPLATPIMNTLSGDKRVGDPSFVEEVAKAMPPLRYLPFLDPYYFKPEISYTPMEHAARLLLPTRKVRDRHEQRLLVSRFSEAERHIKHELTNAVARNDVDAVQILREDLEQAGTALRSAIDRLEK